MRSRTLVTARSLERWSMLRRSYRGRLHGRRARLAASLGNHAGAPCSATLGTCRLRVSRPGGMLARGRGSPQPLRPLPLSRARGRAARARLPHVREGDRPSAGRNVRALRACEGWAFAVAVSARPRMRGQGEGLAAMSLERDAAAAQALLGWGGGGAAAFLFSLVLFGTGGNKKPWVVQPRVSTAADAGLSAAAVITAQLRRITEGRRGNRTWACRSASTSSARPVRWGCRGNRRSRCTSACILARRERRA